MDRRSWCYLFNHRLHRLGQRLDGDRCERLCRRRYDADCGCRRSHQCESAVRSANGQSVLDSSGHRKSHRCFGTTRCAVGPCARRTVVPASALDGWTLESTRPLGLNKAAPSRVNTSVLPMSALSNRPDAYVRIWGEPDQIPSAPEISPSVAFSASLTLTPPPNRPPPSGAASAVF